MHDKLVHNPYRLQTCVGAPIVMPSTRGTLLKFGNKTALKRSKTINSLMICPLRGLSRYTIGIQMDAKVHSGVEIVME